MNTENSKEENKSEIDDILTNISNTDNNVGVVNCIKES